MRGQRAVTCSECTSILLDLGREGISRPDVFAHILPLAAFRDFHYFSYHHRTGVCCTKRVHVLGLEEIKLLAIMLRLSGFYDLGIDLRLFRRRRRAGEHWFYMQSRDNDAMHWEAALQGTSVYSDAPRHQLHGENFSPNGCLALWSEDKGAWR